MKNIKVLKAPTVELARTLIGKVEHTVEAEYGEWTLEGLKNTLAHHGKDAPPVCLWKDVKLAKASDTIVVSHLDLDTVGGIMRLLNLVAPNQEQFWDDVAKVDVTGRSIINDLPSADLLNAYYAGNSALTTTTNKTTSAEPQIADVTVEVWDRISLIFDLFDPVKLAILIEAYHEHCEAKIELVKKAEVAVYSVLGVSIRVFSTDQFIGGINSEYEDRQTGTTHDVIIAYSELSGSFTLSFLQGGKAEDLNACKIMQTVFGLEAGGHKGIAGSSRGKSFDFSSYLRKIIEQIELELKSNY